MAHWVELAQVRVPSSISCIEDAHAALTAGQGKEVASRMARVICRIACFIRPGSVIA